MLTSLTGLRDAPLEILSGQGMLRDIFFDRRSGTLQFLAIEIGPPERTEALVRAERLSTPIHEDGPWTLTVSNEELAEAPSWPEVLERDALDLTSWPLLVVGPFGNTIAPLLALTGLRAEMAKSEMPHGAPADSAAADALVAPLEQVSAWIGAPVFGWDGEMGHLDDMKFEPATRTIRELSVSNGSGTMTDLPFSTFRHRAEEGGHIVLDAHLRDISGNRSD